jgi:hypothetical protein
VLARERDDTGIDLEDELARLRSRRLDVARQRARAPAHVEDIHAAARGPERVDQVRDPPHVAERQHPRVAQVDLSRLTPVEQQRPRGRVPRVGDHLGERVVGAERDGGGGGPALPLSPAPALVHCGASSEESVSCSLRRARS